MSDEEENYSDDRGYDADIADLCVTLMKAVAQHYGWDGEPGTYVIDADLAVNAAIRFMATIMANTPRMHTASNRRRFSEFIGKILAWEIAWMRQKGGSPINRINVTVDTEGLLAKMDIGGKPKLREPPPDAPFEIEPIRKDTATIVKVKFSAPKLPDLPTGPKPRTIGSKCPRCRRVHD